MKPCGCVAARGRRGGVLESGEDLGKRRQASSRECSDGLVTGSGCAGRPAGWQAGRLVLPSVMFPFFVFRLASCVWSNNVDAQ